MVLTIIVGGRERGNGGRERGSGGKERGVEGERGGVEGGEWREGEGEGDTHPYGMKCMKLGPMSFMKRLGKMSAKRITFSGKKTHLSGECSTTGITKKVSFSRH